MSKQTRPKVHQVLPLVNELYAGKRRCSRDRGHVGGHLHIALDDGNVQDYHLEFCLEYARKDVCTGCIDLTLLMLQMSMKQRYRLYGEHK